MYKCNCFSVLFVFREQKDDKPNSNLIIVGTVSGVVAFVSLTAAFIMWLCLRPRERSLPTKITLQDKKGSGPPAYDCTDFGK